MRGLHSLLGRVEAVVAGTFLILMVVLIFTGGVARLMSMPLNWTIDLATCLFAWACFLAADIAWRRGGLMSIDLVIGNLGEVGRRWLMTVNLLLITGFLGYLIWYGVKLSWISRARSFQGIPDVSYAWVTMSLPVGAAFLLLTTLVKLHDLWNRDAAPALAPKL